MLAGRKNLANKILLKTSQYFVAWQVYTRILVGKKWQWNGLLSVVSAHIRFGSGTTEELVIYQHCSLPPAPAPPPPGQAAVEEMCWYASGDDEGTGCCDGGEVSTLNKLISAEKVTCTNWKNCIVWHLYWCLCVGVSHKKEGQTNCLHELWLG